MYHKFNTIVKQTILSFFTLFLSFASFGQVNKNTVVVRELTTPENEFFQNVAFQAVLRSGRVIDYNNELRTINIELRSVRYTFYSSVSISVRSRKAYATGVVHNGTANFVISNDVVGVQRKAYEDLETFLDNIVPKEMATTEQIETIKEIASSGRYNEIEQRQILGQLDRLTKEKADRLISRLNSQ